MATAKKVSSKKKVSGKSTAPKAVKKIGKKAVAKADVSISLLKPGQKAPAFSLSDESGKKVSLSSLKGKKLVLYFYPKDHTPGCTQESCDFRDSFARIKRAGALVFGVSRDSVTSHEKFKAKLELPFSLLSDEEGKMCEAYDVWKEKSMYGRKYMGIVRTTVIVDENGKIIQVFPKVSIKGHADEVLNILEAHA